MIYLLDTNVCIKYLNGRSPSIRQRLQATCPSDIYVCSIVKAELFSGAYKSQDPTRTLRQQQTFLSPFISLPFDDQSTLIYGRIRTQLEAEGRLIGSYDLLIAAIALSNDLTLVTHNVGEFSRIPDLKIEDWQTET